MTTYNENNPVHQFIQRRAERRKTFELPAEEILTEKAQEGLVIPPDQILENQLPGCNLLLKTRIDFRYGFLEHTPCIDGNRAYIESYEAHVRSKIDTIITSQPDAIQAVFHFKRIQFEDAAKDLILCRMTAEMTGLTEEQIHQDADQAIPLMQASREN